MADVAVQPLVEAPASDRAWSLTQRILFRFFCCYWLLYALPESGRVWIFGSVPGIDTVMKPYTKMWHAVVPWVAIHIFHVTGRPATYFPTGSGDTTLQYIHNLLYLVVALAATAIWSILDRRRAEYRTLHGWLRLLVRYTLSFTLLDYGFVKVFPLQFRQPGFARLIEPYGEFSPMGALWWFMGASTPYIIFSGAAEVTGGLLLLFRRTTSLGAMVSFAVMANVVALNYCYDVPVKLYSSNILLMAVFLAAPDLRRLADVLVFNRASVPVDLSAPRFEHRWVRIAAAVFGVLLVGTQLVENLYQGWKGYQQSRVHPARPPLYGLYDAESGAPPNWRKVAVDFQNGFTVRMTDDTTRFFQTDYDLPKSAITVNKKDTLGWTRPDPDHVVLSGTWEGTAITIRLRKIDASKFLLVSRGFHWINEMPLNR
ncbi:MAG: hypothetical protein C5B56_03095 [Proteobacteria bacterium]|nr:MAG: hypothetical protein C5B56_03095 [Pseudomonadota bacterium]